jgi:ABC-type nickel/cobalt efflux system permease component RcnA
MRKISTGCLFAFFAIACLIGLGLRVISGGPISSTNWQYWLGTAIIAVLMTFAGLAIAIAVAIDPLFVLELRQFALNVMAYRSPQDRVTRTEQIGWFIFGLFMTLLGIMSFLSVLAQWCT